MSEYDPQKDGLESYNVWVASQRAKLLQERCPAAKRVEVIGQCELYLGDSLEILPTLEKVDAVVTDPPYGIVNKFGAQAKKDGKRTLQFAWDGAHTNPVVFAAVSAAGDLAQSVFTFCGVSQVSHLETALQDRFTVKPAVWVKACPPPAMPGNWWPSGFEYALYAYRQGAYFADADRSRSNVFYSDTYRAGIRADEKVNHPTQKWLPLLERIVRSMVPEGGTALDVFMGSGTTGVACARNGRRFIGIEIDEGYFDIACERIRKAYAQPDMFVSAPKTEEPKQEAFL